VTWLEVVVIVVLLSNLLMGYSVVKYYIAHPTLAPCKWLYNYTEYKGVCVWSPLRFKAHVTMCTSSYCI